MSEEPPSAPASTPGHTPPTPPSRIEKWRARPSWQRATAWLVLGFFVGLSISFSDAQTIELQAEQEAVETVSDAEEEAEEIVGDARADLERAGSAKADADTARAESERLGERVANRTAELRKIEKRLKGAKGDLASRNFEGSGMYLVGQDIRPGTYKAPATPGCYYARLSDLNGGVNSIITNGNVDGPVVVQVASSDKALEVNGCGTFTRVG